MNKSLLAALALLPVIAIGGEQVILKKDFDGFAMRKTRHVDGWSLLSYCPGELSREKGALMLKAMPANGRDWGQMLCVFRNGNLTGCEIKLCCKVKGAGKIRFGAVRYRAGQKSPDKSDSFWSGLMELGGDYKDYEYAVAFGDQPLDGVNFLFEIQGPGGEAVIDSVTVTSIGDTGCEIRSPDPIMVKDTEPLPDVKFQTNRPGRKFRYYTSILGNPQVAHGGTAAADEKGVVTISGKSLRQDQAAQKLFLVVDGNAVFLQGETGCDSCDMGLHKNPTVGSVMIVKIPSDEYDASLQAAKNTKLGDAKKILILADSLWDFDRGANAADRMNFFLRKAQGDDIKVVNYAVHGDLIDRTVARFKGDFATAGASHGKARYRNLKNENPDLIMIMLGHNDTTSNSRDNFASPRVVPEVQKAKYGELLAAIKETFPKSKVILLTPVSVNYEGILKRCEEKRKAGATRIFRFGDPDKVGAFRRILAEVAAEHRLPLFDMHTPTEHLDDKPSYFRPDNVHLSPRGYGLVARLVLEEMGKDMEPYSSTPAIAGAARAADTGFVDLFDGRTLNGWKTNGGSAEYRVEDGTIAGVGVPGTPGNTFLCTEREYENFIFKAEFKCPSGNSGIQFRSSVKPARNFKNGTSVYGYQCEITPYGGNSGRIYDEGRRGFRNGIIWLGNTPKERQEEMLKKFRKNDWNSVEIQCVGPSIKTFINGVKVSDILDDCQQRGFFGLQIHAQKKTNKDGTPTESGRAWWRNIRIKELPPCPAWKKFFVRGTDGKMNVDGAKYVIPQDWSFVEDKDGAYLRGVHDKTEKKDGLLISLADYDNFMARVTYKLNGGNSALYFRAEEEDIPWVLKGFQNEIAGNSKDSALWHTRGKKTKGRGWVASNDELVAKVRDAKGGWNTVSTIAVGDRIVNRINGFETFDIVDPLCEKTGKLGLQLHGGADNEMRFKDWEVMPVEPWMLPYIQR